MHFRWSSQSVALLLIFDYFPIVSLFIRGFFPVGNLKIPQFSLRKKRLKYNYESVNCSWSFAAEFNKGNTQETYILEKYKYVLHI